MPKAANTMRRNADASDSDESDPMRLDRHIDDPDDPDEDDVDDDEEKSQDQLALNSKERRIRTHGDSDLDDDGEGEDDDNDDVDVEDDDEEDDDDNADRSNNRLHRKQTSDSHHINTTSRQKQTLSSKLRRAPTRRTARIKRPAKHSASSADESDRDSNLDSDNSDDDDSDTAPRLIKRNRSSVAAAVQRAAAAARGGGAAGATRGRGRGRGRGAKSSRPAARAAGKKRSPSADVAPTSKRRAASRRPRTDDSADDDDFLEDSDEFETGLGVTPPNDIDNQLDSRKIKTMEKLLGRKLQRVDVAPPDELSAAESRAASLEPLSTATVPKTTALDSTTPEVPASQPNSSADAAHPLAYLYLVKWKGLSYIHCEWIPEARVLQQSQGKGRLQRFIRNKEIAAHQREGNEDDIEEEDPIPEDFVTVDRILAEKVLDGKKMYYVKWRALSYAEGTWELAEDLKDDQKITEFVKRNQMPSPEQDLLKPTARPPKASFEKMPMPVFKNGGQLREYQMEGYNWLISCWFAGQGSILADEMGLGKTIQSVSFCNYLFHNRNVRGPFLVIAPLSTLGHWSREFEVWTHINAIVYHGTSDSRRIIQEYEWAYPNQSNKRGPPYKWDALITTYETILQDSSKLRSIHWEGIIIDEAHKIKNRSSRLVNELDAFHSDHRILLTGTPIQNNPLEVWALLYFIDKEKFASQDEFQKEFGEIKDSETVNRLKELMRPYLLRRLKEDVEKSIPPKEETIVSVELTRVQKKWYRAMLEQNFSFLDHGSKSTKNIGNLRNIVMELRKCCNHPYLIKGVEQIETAEIEDQADECLMNRMVHSSGKLVLVDKLLPRLKADGHKVLIFSQMIKVLDIVEDYLVGRRWGFERIDGRVRGNDRQQAIDRFCKKDSDKFVFLLCTRAGGQGINLTVADTVIIYDSDWNPQNDIQAQARCHRIGQKSDVKVYRLITRGTYEQDMFDRASKKLGLDHAVLQNMGVETEATKKSQNLLAEMKKEDVDSLLKKGAYDVFNEDDSAADAFSSEDIDLILARRTTLLNTGATNAGPSAFSKASFAAEAPKEGENVELDDPDFWKKLMPAAANGPDPALELRPRVRRQTQRFAPGEDSSDEEIDDASGDELYSGLAPSGKKFWNKGERQRAQRGLMTLGWGRWRSMYRLTDLGDRRPMDEIAYFCRRFVRLAVEMIMANKSDEEITMESLMSRFTYLSDVFTPHTVILEDDPNSPVNPGDFKQTSEYRYGQDLEEPMFTEPVLQSAEFQDYLSRNSNHLIERMDLLAEIAMLGDEGMLNANSQIPFVGASGSQIIGEWWDHSFDRDLLRGTLKYGYGNYRPMRTDPDLVFHKYIEKIPEDDADGESRHHTKQGHQKGDVTERKGTKIDGPEDVNSKDTVVDGDELARKDSKTVKDFTKEITNGKEMTPGRNLVVKPLGGLERLEGDMEEKLVQQRAGSAEPKKESNAAEEMETGRVKEPEGGALGSTSDKLDEVGAKTTVPGDSTPSSDDPSVRVTEEKVGTGETPLSPGSGGHEGVEEKLAGATHSETKTCDTTGLRGWPAVQVLNTRVKKLTKGFQRLRKKRERQVKVEEEAEKQRLVKEEKRREKEADDEAKRKQKERKIAALQRVWSKKEKSDFAKYITNVGEAPMNESGEVSWRMVQERAGLTKKMPEVIAEYVEDFFDMCQLSIHLEKNDIDTWNGRLFSEAEREDAKATVVNAKRWYERRSLVMDIRDILLPKLDNVETKEQIWRMANPVKKDGLPKWWNENPGLYDMCLLKALGKHGIDPGLLATDKEFPFWMQCAESVIGYYKGIPKEAAKAASVEGDDCDMMKDPETVEEVSTSDLVNFFARDRAVFCRAQAIRDKVMAVVAPPQRAGRGKKRVAESTNGSDPPGPSAPEWVKVEGHTMMAANSLTGFSNVLPSDLSRRVLKSLKGYRRGSATDGGHFPVPPDWAPPSS